MLENRIKNYLLLHLIVFIWGFTAILGALISISAISLVWYRMSLATVFILIYFLFKKKSLKVDKKGVFKFIFTGTIIALHWIFFFKAIKVSNVSVALVTMSTGAFFVSIIEPIFFKRRIRPLEMVLGLIVILGLYIIFSFENQYKMGIIYAIISSSLFILPNIEWFYLLVLSSICTAYAFIISVKVMKYLSPYTVMLTVNLEPIYAIFLALFIFGDKEKMNPEFYLGAFIVLFVVLLNGIIKNRVAIKNKIINKNVRKK